MTTPLQIQRLQQHIDGLEAERERAKAMIETLRVDLDKETRAVERMLLRQQIQHWRDDLEDTEERIQDARQDLARRLSVPVAVAESKAAQ